MYAQTTTTFRTGQNGYTGNVTVAITNQGGGDGGKKTGDTLPVFSVTGTSPYANKTLVRFDSLVLPAGHTVVSASLTLTFSTWTSGFQVVGKYLKNQWDPASTALNWKYRTSTLTWGAPGASAVGVDIEDGKSLLYAGFRATGDQTYTVPLDPVIVAAWVSNPSAAQGVTLAVDAADKIARVYSSTVASLTKRPLLTIVTSPPADPDVTPPTVSVTSPSPGATVSGVVTLAANATDNFGVTSVQFLIDDVPVGSALTVSPYTMVYDTGQLLPGSHTIKARAQDAAGNQATSPGVPVIVSAAQGSDFFSPPMVSGTVPVRLYPMENVSAGTTKLVTFGLPFPTGSITESGLVTVRVLTGTTEIPANVQMLTPWRHITNSAKDGIYVRAARVQFQYTFGVTYPNSEVVTVQWGIQNRTADVTVGLDPRTAWHKVSSGSFATADNVYEPDVFALLPASYLTLGQLAMRMLPFDPSVTEARSNPTDTKNRTDWPGYLELQTAAKNFFYTIINQDDPLVTSVNKSPYKTAYEPWLYDRSTAMYLLYYQSGFLKALREAVRSTEFYINQLYTNVTDPPTARGVFKLKVPDPKGYIDGNGTMYSYNQCLAYQYWLTGDTRSLNYIRWVSDAHERYTEATRWASGSSAWTERHTGFRLLANTIAYEVFGEPAYRALVQAQSGDFIWHQNGAGGGIPAARIDGGLYHYGRQHGDGPPTAFIASPWMSAITQDAMVRVYGLTEDLNVADFVRRMGTFLMTASKTDTLHYLSAGPLRYPDYLTLINGSSSIRNGDETEHAIEVASAIAWSKYFADRRGLPDPALRDAVLSLYKTEGYAIRHWTRPDAPSSVGKPAYRVSPWRKYSWQHVPAAYLPWVMQ